MDLTNDREKIFGMSGENLYSVDKIINSAECSPIAINKGNKTNMVVIPEKMGSPKGF